MKSKGPVPLLVGIALAMPACMLEPEPMGRDALESSDDELVERAIAAPPKVFAHYYPWWGGGCDDFSLEPTYGWYRNQSWGAAPGVNDDAIATVEQELRDASAHGVTGFAIEWPGRGSAEGQHLDEVILPAIENEGAEFYITFDSDIWHINNWGRPPSGLVDLWEAQRNEFPQEVGHICEQWAQHPQYHTVDGRPVVFIYGYNRWAAPDFLYVQQAIAWARSECMQRAGLDPFFIGDFQIAPRAWGWEYGPNDYAAKAQLVDAVGNYALFGGYGYASEVDSLKRFAEDGRLWQALSNGQALADSAGIPFFPGIQPQYFKADRDPATCGPASAIDDDDTKGYMPAARASDPGGATAASRAAIDLLVNNYRSFPRTFQEMTITTWNEPIEGTGVFPTVDANGEGFVMGTYFLDVFDRFARGACGGWCTY